MDNSLVKENSCSTRKRLISDSESVDPKKVKTVNWENQTAMPKMGESVIFLFSAIQSLANNISVSFNMMNNPNE